MQQGAMLCDAKLKQDRALYISLGRGFFDQGGGFCFRKNRKKGNKNFTYF